MMKVIAILAVIAVAPVSTLAGQVSTSSSAAKHCTLNKAKEEYKKPVVTATVSSENAVKAQ